MTLERLWAGWRTAYVSGSGTGTGGEGEVEGTSGDAGSGPGSSGPGSSGPGDDSAECVFCRIAASGGPSPDNGVLWVGRTTLVVLNAYPYASGHLMAIPLRHVRSLDGLDDDESAELWAATRLGVAAIEAAYQPGGINLGANLGEAAGAGIPRHLHLHAVPRWTGDTNFMTAIADTRVLPETLNSTWERLTAAWPVGGESGPA